VVKVRLADIEAVGTLIGNGLGQSIEQPAERAAQ
jgi:hypothetical protein